MGRSSIVKSILLIWLVVATVLALESPRIKPFKVFVGQLIWSDVKSVSLAEGSVFVEEFLSNAYFLDNSPTDLNRYFGSALSDSLLESVREDLQRSIERRSKASVGYELLQLIFNKKHNIYRASFIEKRAGAAGFLIVEVAIEKENGPDSYIKVTQWDEKPSPEKPSFFLEPEIYLGDLVSTRLEFPCESIQQKSIKGVTTKTVSVKNNSSSLLEFGSGDGQLVGVDHRARCKNRTFSNTLSRAEHKYTVYRKVSLNEGRLPPKLDNTQDLLKEGISSWTK